MSLPDWKPAIDIEFTKYKSGKQTKANYLVNLVNYFTGPGNAKYPVMGQLVKPTDLTQAELIKYELPDFDIRKIAMQLSIVSNMVLSTRLPRDWAGVKGLIDGAKTEGKFARSPAFTTYTAEEQAIWNACEIPVIGTGTVSAPTNDPLYNQLCDIYNNPASKAFRDAGQWDKYYGDFCIGATTGTGTGTRTASIGPANGFITDKWDKSFFRLSATQLKGFQLPTDDGRRLQIAMIREKYRNAILSNPAGPDAATQTAFKTNITAMFDDKKYQYSPPLSSTEQTNASTPPTVATGLSAVVLPAGAPALVAAPEPPVTTGGRRRGKKSTRGKRSTRKNKRTRRR